MIWEPPESLRNKAYRNRIAPTMASLIPALLSGTEVSPRGTVRPLNMFTVTDEIADELLPRCDEQGEIPECPKNFLEIR